MSFEVVDGGKSSGEERKDTLRNKGGDLFLGLENCGIQVDIHPGADVILLRTKPVPIGREFAASQRGAVLIALNKLKQQIEKAEIAVKTFRLE